jgi:2-oxoglutarate/2-oxoacid ferredoxin oxidoreductase subunit alpha
LKCPRGDGELLYMDGNQVLGMAALASGCRFLSAYPMTPATGIMTYLAGKSAAHGLVVEQAEDEIAAINMALGASYGGARSMTATSGGGFALMVEGLSLAGMTETPIVIALAMRPGPATGLPTRTEQGDLDFALHGGHGEFPRAVLSATTHEDAFYRLNKAFELADKYQVPVIFLSDQNFADTQRSVKPFDFSRLGYNRCLAAGEDIQKPYKRYRFSEDGISPRILPGMVPGEVVLSDSDEHDEKGNIIEDASARRAMMDKRMKKLTGLAEAMDEPEYYGDEEAEILLLGWGSTYGVLRETVDALRQEGLATALLHFSDLWPLPQGRLRASLPRAKKSFCVENNATGQFAALVRRVNRPGGKSKYPKI